MNTLSCPHCRQMTRAGTRFCSACGKDMQAAGATPVAAAGNFAHKAGEIASQAGQAAAPYLQQAAVSSWQQSKRGAGWLRRVLTGGGRAAYSEVTTPFPVSEGWIRALVPPRQIVPPLEIAAFIFTLILLLSWLIVLLPGWWAGVVLATSFFSLFVLSFAGVKRPFFTKMTFQRLLGQLSQINVLEFHVQEAQTNRQLRVEMWGVQSPPSLPSGAYVQLYGIENKGQAVVRVWWCNVLDQNGHTQMTVSAPRLLPLTLALFLPLFLNLIIWVVALLLQI
jgi:hypothetical protein